MSRQGDEIGVESDLARWIARRRPAKHPGKQSCLPFDHVDERVTRLSAPVDGAQEQPVNRTVRNWSLPNKLAAKGRLPDARRQNI